MDSQNQNPFYNEQADLKWKTPLSAEENVTNTDQILTPAHGGKDADSLVRETEDASLPDKEYSFDEDNTGTEEYHDADDATESSDHAFDV